MYPARDTCKCKCECKWHICKCECYDQEKHIIKMWLRLVAWLWHDIFEAHFLAIPGNLLLVLQRSLKQLAEQFEAKTSILKNKVKKLLDQKDFKKCLESNAVLCFLLQFICHTFAVFRRNKVILRHAVVNANLFIHLFNFFILWMYNKAHNVKIGNLKLHWILVHVYIIFYLLMQPALSYLFIRCGTSHALIRKILSKV